MTAGASQLEYEVGRIRELSKRGRHDEALVAAATLACEAPENRDVLYLIAANQRCLNQISEALATLQRVEEQDARFSLLYQERGHCYLALRDAARAIEAFERGVRLNPALITSWRLLERLYRMTGQVKNAETAAGYVSTLKQLPPNVVHAASLLSDGSLEAAENIVRDYLRKNGSHCEALRLLARIDHQRGALDEAEELLEDALKVAPDSRAARSDYVRVLMDRQKYMDARDELERLLSSELANKDYLSLYAGACAGLGEHERAIAVYRQLLEAAAPPKSAELHVSLGHALQAAGRSKDAIASFELAAAARPGFGDAYWSLANLKTYRFPEDEIARMRAAEADAGASSVDRWHLCFALGKALEDRGEYEESWKFYQRGNALKRAGSYYRPEITETNTRKQMEVCTARFFETRVGFGVPAADPIFIVGLPRSGSTLIEQILASHSQVEGTQELADIQRIVLSLERHTQDRPDAADRGYPGALAQLKPEEFRSLGDLYLTGARCYRKTKKPFFIDKMPNNFRHIGLIHLMLPNCKVLDLRREPMACCFSNLKQLFASGQEFTYSVEDIARYYRTYLELMRHWDAVLPGRVLKVLYEGVVEDLEGNVRQILDFCGLEFEPACLEFYKNERSVRTASSEQVRRPIFREALAQWRNYEPWLAPLKDALGEALTAY